MYINEVKQILSIVIKFLFAFVVLRYFLGGSLPRKTVFLGVFGRSISKASKGLPV